MAGGKQSPRQKMISLMYLVFIAMMALNMSKEVLSAFGLMDEKFEGANITSKNTNKTLLDGLGMRAQDEPKRYGEPYAKAQQVQKISDDFFGYINSLKADAIQGFEIDPETKKLPYEQMDKAQGIDYSWFEGDGLSAKGSEIMARFKKYRDDLKAVVGNDVKYKFFLEDIEKRFNTSDIKNKDGQEIDYLDYHFKGFPAIASKAKLSAMQNDIRELEHEAYNLFLGNSLKLAASMKNYQAMVISDKSVYYQGEQIKYKVVLGRFDESTVPTSVTVNGSAIPQSRIKMGQVEGSSVAGSIGEHKFTGKFTFMEDGEPVVVDILNSNYVVVGRPSTATISADKMNVVYAGLDNPISITVEGITSDKVSASVTNGTLTKVGNGKYMLKPGSGRELTVNATGTMPDGKAITSKQVFRIKAIPRPSGRIRGEVDAKGPASNFANVNITAIMEDFDFPVNLRVTQYTIVFPGMGSETVSGGGLPESAKMKAQRLRPGDVVRITNIKAKLEGVTGVLVKDPTPATYTIQ